MAINIEEIQNALREDATLQKEVISFVNGTDAGKENLSAYLKSKEADIISENTKKIYNNLDKDIMDTLGVRKGDSEKTYDFLKTQLGKIKGLESQVTELSKGDDKAALKTLKAELETEKSKTTNSEHWHNTHLKAIEAWETKEKGFVEQLNTEKANSKNMLINVEVAKEIASFDFNNELPQEVIDTMVKSTTDSILSSAFIGEDGKVSYKNSDGSPMTNESTFKAITTKELLTKGLTPILSTEQGGGATTKGSRGGVTAGKGDSAKILTLKSGSFATKSEFLNVANETLTKNGIVGEQRQQMIDAAYVENNVVNLPRN